MATPNITTSGSPKTRRSGVTMPSKENMKPAKEAVPPLDAFHGLNLGSAVSDKLRTVSQEHKAKLSLESSPTMDKLLAKLNEQQLHLNKQQESLQTSVTDTGYARTLEYIHNTANSVPITPATDVFSPSLAARSQSTTPTSKEDSNSTSGEVLRLRSELEAAKAQMARMDQELAQTRIPKQLLNQPLGVPSEGRPIQGRPVPDQQYADQVGAGFERPVFSREQSWGGLEDGRSEISEAFSATGFNRAREIWNRQSVTNAQGVAGLTVSDSTTEPWIQRGPSPAYGDPRSQGHMATLRSDRSTPEPDLYEMSQGYKRHIGRVGPIFTGRNMAYDGPMMRGLGSMDASITSHVGPGLVSSRYQPRPIGTPLSPHAPEFTSTTLWKEDNMGSQYNTFDATRETHINYRKMLDRHESSDWKLIIDKIVCANDQQASIFLQQKLKVGTPDQKFDIVEGIAAQAYPLMINRFGNFLVQRCFEHGTPEQVIKIAEAIRGHTLALSMDAFGCHVIQKAFDCVPEEYKAMMVHELLRCIPETVIHRYACHVWQKLFELRWTESPPQIMKYVNEALRGLWHEVALGETGSLVVQNIFENCLEDDKRPCIEEVLASIDIVAHGQFGNWCIQHICEHGAPADKSRAIDHVIRYASEYSMDQFASKVVEKCLKIGGAQFLDRYLDRVCEGRHDRPRIPLIDIASDQYGNYLIQYILQNADLPHREVVAAHIRKHMVSLRGSKFGSRVGMLCTNPALQTRPGPSMYPGMGPIVPRMNTQSSRYGGGPYR